MSSTGSAISGVVGAIAGFFIGGPTGAVYGAQIGMGIGSIIDPPKGPTIVGPRLSSLTVQTSTYGADIPRIHGIDKFIGNVFWLYKNKLTEKKKKKKSGGKGGGGKKVKTYSYFATFAVGLCQGPVAGVRRLWVGSDLIYDSTDLGLTGIVKTGKKTQYSWTLYRGTDDQLPDPIIQSDVGVDNASGYPGICYIVFNDLPLAKYQNSLMGAQIKAELIAEATATTSMHEQHVQLQTITFEANVNAGYGWPYIEKEVDGVLYIGVRDGFGWENPRYLFKTDGTYIGRRTTTAPAATGAQNSDDQDVSSAYNICHRKFGTGMQPPFGAVTYLADSSESDAEYVFSVIDPAKTGIIKIGQVADLSNGSYRIVSHNLPAGFKLKDVIASVDGTTLIAVIDQVNGSGKQWYELDSMGNILRQGSTGPDYVTFTYTLTHWSGQALTGVTPESCYDPSTDMLMTYNMSDNYLYVFKIGDPWQRLYAKNMMDYNFSPDNFMWKGRCGVLQIGMTSVLVNYHSLYFFSWITEYTSTTYLKDVVKKELLRSNLLTESDIDTSTLIDLVRGYQIDSAMEIREALRPLQMVWPFDIRMHGYKLECIRRGSNDGNFTGFTQLRLHEIQSIFAGSPNDYLQVNNQLILLKNTGEGYLIDKDYIIPLTWPIPGDMPWLQFCNGIYFLILFGLSNTYWYSDNLVNWAILPTPVGFNDWDLRISYAIQESDGLGYYFHSQFNWIYWPADLSTVSVISSHPSFNQLDTITNCYTDGYWWVTDKVGSPQVTTKFNNLNSPSFIDANSEIPDGLFCQFSTCFGIAYLSVLGPTIEDIYKNIGGTWTLIQSLPKGARQGPFSWAPDKFFTYTGQYFNIDNGTIAEPDLQIFDMVAYLNSIDRASYWTLNTYVNANNLSVIVLDSDLSYTETTIGVFQFEFKDILRISIPVTDLDARDYEDSPGVQLIVPHEMDSQLSQKISIQYKDVTREYDTGEQSTERFNTDSKNSTTIQVKIVMTPDEAKKASEVLLYSEWRERKSDFQFKLPSKYLNLEPADIINLTDRFGMTHTLRLTNINYTQKDILECTARRENPSGYTSSAVGSGSEITDEGMYNEGPAITLLLNLPQLYGNSGSAGFYVAMAGVYEKWPGGTLYESYDNGQSWSDILSATDSSVFGTTEAPLSSTTVFDRYDFTSTLKVALTNGELFSVTHDELSKGANLFAYGAEGRWEILSVRTVVQNSDGTYNLYDFIRGKFGTERLVGTHQNYDTIVKLSIDDIYFVPIDSALINASETFRAVSLNADFDDDPYNTTFACTAVNLKPLSPVYLNGGRNPTTNDWNLQWKRRARVNGEWRSGADVPLDEATEEYTLEFYVNSNYNLFGAAPVRTVIVPNWFYDYTSAMQITDFGSNQSTLYVMIYQNSALVGKGYPLMTSITR